MASMVYVTGTKEQNAAALKLVNQKVGGRPVVIETKDDKMDILLEERIYIPSLAVSDVIGTLEFESPDLQRVLKNTGVNIRLSLYNSEDPAMTVVTIVLSGSPMVRTIVKQFLEVKLYAWRSGKTGFLGQSPENWDSVMGKMQTDTVYGNRTIEAMEFETSIKITIPRSVAFEVLGSDESICGDIFRETKATVKICPQRSPSIEVNLVVAVIIGSPEDIVKAQEILLIRMLNTKGYFGKKKNNISFLNPIFPFFFSSFFKCVVGTPRLPVQLSNNYSKESGGISSSSSNAIHHASAGTSSPLHVSMSADSASLKTDSELQAIEIQLQQLQMQRDILLNGNSTKTTKHGRAGDSEGAYSSERQGGGSHGSVVRPHSQQGAISNKSHNVLKQQGEYTAGRPGSESTAQHRQFHGSSQPSSGVPVFINHTSAAPVVASNPQQQMLYTQTPSGLQPMIYQSHHPAYASSVGQQLVYLAPNNPSSVATSHGGMLMYAMVPVDSNGQMFSRTPTLAAHPHNQTIIGGGGSGVYVTHTAETVGVHSGGRNFKANSTGSAGGYYAATTPIPSVVEQQTPAALFLYPQTNIPIQESVPAVSWAHPVSQQPHVGVDVNYERVSPDSRDSNGGWIARPAYEKSLSPGLEAPDGTVYYAQSSPVISSPGYLGPQYAIATDTSVSYPYFSLSPDFGSKDLSHWNSNKVMFHGYKSSPPVPSIHDSALPFSPPSPSPSLVKLQSKAGGNSSLLSFPKNSSSGSLSKSISKSLRAQVEGEKTSSQDLKSDVPSTDSSK